jgi:hypothetical protein
MELVDYNEAMLGKGEVSKTKATRRRKPAAGKKKTDAAVETVAEKTVEAPAEAHAEEKAPEEEK